jgi:hypothetical protein
VLSNLMGLFGGKPSNRREHERVKKAYKAAYSLDGETWRPAIGVDLSDEGMCILTQEATGDRQFSVRATLGTKVVNMRCIPVWQSKVNHNGKPVECYGLKFVGIGADDWDTVVRFISGEDLEPKNKAQEELETVKIKTDDVARMLPQAFQHKLFAELVKRHRLASLEEKPHPLVQFEYGGVAPWRGKNMHRLTIHSKLMDGKKEERFSTRFMFDDSGKEIIVLN